MSPADVTAIVARFLQFAGGAVLSGGSLFFLYGPRPAGRWRSRLMGLAAAAGAIGTLGWLMAQAGEIGETPGAAFDPAVVWSVAAETSFGPVAAARFGLFVLALVAAFVGPGGRNGWLILAGLGAAATASFAWTGHGARDDGFLGAIHLAGDAVHLLAAAVWIGALAALAALLLRAARGVDATAAADSVHGLARFSAIGVWVVAALALSGLVNSWLLVGLAGISRLPTTPYGQLLLAKLGLFGVMLVLAAANRWRHTPRLERVLQWARADAAAVRPVTTSVLAETALAVAVLALVSWMGTLPPPIDG